MNFTHFPRRNYLQGPTPIEPMPNLTESLGNTVNLYIKRDDLLPGAGGGNKTRKLEFCLADAIEKGADAIVTCGSVQSNHCRLTLAWSVKENLDCHLILTEPFKGLHKEDAGGNFFLFHLLGAKSIEHVKSGSDIMTAMEKKVSALKGEGKVPYCIPVGASNAVGSLGYAACAEEIMGQLNDMRLSIDHIVLPAGSAGTQAGLIAGMTGTNANIPVTGINVLQKKAEQQDITCRLARETAEKLGITPGVHPGDIICFDDYLGPGYSRPTDAMVAAVNLFAKKEAILLDPVYTGKAAAGLIDLVKNGYFHKGANVLFLHTGGSPALFACQDTFRP